jgi:hypothetical protein
MDRLLLGAKCDDPPHRLRLYPLSSIGVSEGAMYSGGEVPQIPSLSKDTDILGCRDYMRARGGWRPAARGSTKQEQTRHATRQQARLIE